VQQLLRRAGISVVEELPLIPPQPEPEAAAAPAKVSFAEIETAGTLSSSKGSQAGYSIDRPSLSMTPYPPLILEVFEISGLIVYV